MQIFFTPMRRDAPLVLALAGEALTVNGVDYDLSGIPEGATLPRAAVACDWLASDIERVGGVVQLTLILPHGATAPVETLFPVAIMVAGDGPIAVPSYDAAVASEVSA